MGRFFKRLPLPVKLMLLGTLPLILLLWVTFQYTREKEKNLVMVDTYRQRVVQAQIVNALIDQLVVERRYSFGFSLKGSWQNEMLQRRALTDAAIRLMSEKGGDLAAMQQYTFLDRLSTVRREIDEKTIQPDYVINFYSNAIQRLSTQNNIAAGKVQVLLPVSQDIVGQKILSDIISHHGSLRAQIYKMLYNKSGDPQTIASIIQALDIVDSYAKEFMVKASPEARAELNSLATDTDVQVTAKIQQGIRDNLGIDTTIDADYFWDVSANAIDRVRTLQLKMMERVAGGINHIYNEELWARNLSIILLVVMLIVLAAFTLYLIRHISVMLRDLREAAHKLARGETGIEIPAMSNDVMGLLAGSIRNIDQNNKALAEAARKIGSGNFDARVEPRSEQDTLGNALVQMKTNLQRYEKDNAAKIWKQTGLNRVNEKIRGDKPIGVLCNDVLQELVRYLQMEQALMYVVQGDHLFYEAGYAIDDPTRIPRKLAFGETIIGQAAAGKETLVLNDVSEQFLTVRSGLVHAQPRTVIVLPLCNEDVVEGVLELSSLRNLEPAITDFLESISGSIAIALRAIKSRMRLQELFEETQAQSEELQSQHSELENINAELEAQAQKLQASEEELRVQQEELMQANQELEERSRLLEERNQLIVERNLEIQRKAEELALSTRYKSEFLANMSHELRTPLNSILLLSRLLSENSSTNLTAEQVEYAQVIQSSGQGLLTLIDEILDLSKIEAGKMEIELAPVPVTEIINDLRALFAPVAKDKGIQFSVDLSGTVPGLIETDKMRLEQVLKNLLSNALKFTTEGSVVLHIKYVGDQVNFTVTDTGIGIAKEKQDLIFEAFQQEDGTTRRKFGGTGLGLSISRELTKLLGGTLSVTSEPGKGSSFTVLLPVKAGTPVVAALQPMPTIPAVETNTTAAAKADATDIAAAMESIVPAMDDDRAVIKPGDKAILIVEDDKPFAKALMDYTRAKGYKAIVAVRGDEGVHLARHYRPYGILLDVQLPVKSGWEVMDELKKDPLTRSIPVHIMSSNELKKESILRGAVDFINKPMALEQMQEVFRKIEQVVSQEHKKVLIVEENPKHARALAYFLDTFNVTAEISGSVEGGIKALKQEGVDCVILDVGISDEKALDTLENIKKDAAMENIPVIIFTGKNISKGEEQRIRQYADTIVVKTAHSYQRILDEVSLFLHLVEETSGDVKKPASRKMGALNEVLQGRKVLVTDDDVRNIFSLTKALEQFDMQVLTATDGKEALQQLKEHPDIDAVLMDIMMPEMDGYEAIRQIRKQPKFRNLPIITVTAKAMTGDREKSIEAGASDYISKPIDSDQLLSLLRVWLYDKTI